MAETKGQWSLGTIDSAVAPIREEKMTRTRARKGLLDSFCGSGHSCIHADLFKPLESLVLALAFLLLPSEDRLASLSTAACGPGP